MKKAIIAFGCFALAGVARADITVEVLNNIGGNQYHIADFTVANGGIIDRGIIGNYHRWVVNTFNRGAYPGDTTPYTLKIRGTSNDELRLNPVIGWSGGETYIDIAGSAPGSRIGPVRAIEKLGTEGTVWLVNLKMQGTLGGGSTDAIRVDRIVLADIIGDVSNRITAGAAGIESLRITGNMGGTILPLIQSAGVVKTVVITGSLGTNPSQKCLEFGTRLERLTAGSIRGTIGSVDPAVSTVWRVETTAGGFEGSLTCKNLQAVVPNPGGIVVDGGATPSSSVLNADVVIETQATEVITATGGLATGKSIKIVGSYSVPITIIPVGGLHGQVIVNADYGSGTWSSTLTVGSTTVSGYYAATNLGEGAIGAVPFHFQGPECYPPSNGTIPTPMIGTVLYYTFYGPIKRASSVKPVIISRRPSGLTPPAEWEDVSDDFDVSVSGRSVETTHTDASGTHPWLAVGYQYKVEPKTDINVTLLCDGLLSPMTIAPVHSDPAAPYTFFVEGPVVTGCETGCD